MERERGEGGDIEGGRWRMELLPGSVTSKISPQSEEMRMDVFAIVTNLAPSKLYTTVDTSPICKFSQDDEEDDGIRLKKQRYDGGDK